VGDPRRDQRAARRHFPIPEMMRRIAEAAWDCGDPGLQFDTTINNWHTCKATGRINASNPCSEYMFSTTRRAISHRSIFSIPAAGRTVRHRKLPPRGGRDVDRAGDRRRQRELPDAAHRGELVRVPPLGLGYANLGALLMALGQAYDSEAGRAYAGAITASCAARPTRSRRALRRTTRPVRSLQGEQRLVRGRHPPATGCTPTPCPRTSSRASCSMRARELARGRGVGRARGLPKRAGDRLARNQDDRVHDDCDTTGIEPKLGLVKYKKLVGGGLIKIVNNTVPVALKRLGYDKDQIQGILDHIEQKGTAEGAPHLRDEHLPVSTRSFRPANGTRTIAWMGHLRMMAAAQPSCPGPSARRSTCPRRRPSRTSSARTSRRGDSG